MGHGIAVEHIETTDFVRVRFGGDDAETFRHQGRAAQAIAARYSAHAFVGNPNVLTWLLGRAPTSFEAVARREHTAFLAGQPPG